MKKAVAVLFLACTVLLVGCKQSQQSMNVDRICSAYLRVFGVENSTILSADFDKIHQLDTYFLTDPYKRNFNTISDRMDKELNNICNVQVLDTKSIETGDVVGFSVRVINSFGICVIDVGNLKMLIGHDYFGKDIEKELVGLKKNDTIVLSANEAIKKLFRLDEALLVQFTVNDIYQCEIKEEERERLEEWGYTTFSRYFFRTLADLICDEDAANFIEGGRAFFNAAMACCSFALSEQDIDAISDSFQNGAGKLANSFVDMQKEVILAVFIPTNSKEATYQIKKALLIGALAEYFEIRVGDAKLQDFYYENNITSSDERAEIGVKYRVLSEAVIARIRGK